MNTPLSEIERRLAAAESLFIVAEQKHNEAANRCRQISALALAVVAASILFAARPSAHAQGGDLTSRVAALEAKLIYLTTVGTEMTITGANLHIVNGLGTTATTNFTGNLILGYNEARGGINDSRYGSHNLVLGARNNYSSWGGIVAGSVNGGYQNQAFGGESSILGGHNISVAAQYGHSP